MRIPASGMQAAQALLATGAHNIANLSTEGFDAHGASLRAVEPRQGVAVDAVGPGPAGSGVSLPGEIVGVVAARTLYDANARVLRTLDETQRSVIDILA